MATFAAMELVTIAIFPDAFNAHLAQGRLQADGIDAYIQDEHAIQVNPFYNVALGGIKLQVKDNDVQAAVFLLRHTGYRTVFDTAPPVEQKQSPLLLRFLKYLLAVIVVLAFLYLRTFGGKLPV